MGSLWLRTYASTHFRYTSVRSLSTDLSITAIPETSRKKYTTCSGRDKPLRYPLMTMRSKQWYTKTSRLPNSFVNVSIGRPPLIRSRQHDHRSDGRWSQNFKYIWLGIRARSDARTSAALPARSPCAACRQSDRVEWVRRRTE